MSWLTRPRPRDDAGLSLLESVVALTVAAVVLTGFAAVGITGVRTSLLARANQQAGDFLSQRIEQLRLMPFTGLTQTTADVTGKPGVTASGAQRLYNPGTGAEPIALDDTQTGVPVVSNPRDGATADIDNRVTFTLRTYITQPADSYGASYRRVTVEVDWTGHGLTRTRRISTLVTNSERGLPLPRFKFKAFAVFVLQADPYVQSVNPGNPVVFGLAVENQGARDRWDVFDDGLNTWTYYRDVDDNKLWDPTVDNVVVTDTDGNGVRDTGLIEPTRTVRMFAVRTIPAAAGTGAISTTFTAASVSQRANTSLYQTVVTTTLVVAGAIGPTPTPTTMPTRPSNDCDNPLAGVTGTGSNNASVRRFYLSNTDPNGPSTAQQYLALEPSLTPTTATLFNYSTDVSGSTAGRNLVETSDAAAPTEADPWRAAAWRWQVTGQTKLSGTIAVKLYVASINGNTNDRVKLQIYLDRYNAAGVRVATAVKQATLDSPLVSCSGYIPFGAFMSVSMSDQSWANTEYVGIRVVNTGPQPIRVAYDTLLYQSYVDLPVK